jgi:predicted 3-demethylubiquinone-9 3-methyltransferase (glyoxalase superfamily)
MNFPQKISPCLWFDNQGEAAAQFYISIFPNSKITGISRYGEAGHSIHGRPPGSVMTVSFELAGQPFLALNGGSHFKFNEAVSLQVFCDTQDEVDYYWEKLGAGGDEKARQCGWLKDKFGLSWQIVPTIIPEIFSQGVSEKTERAMLAVMRMKKLNIAELKAAFDNP